MSKFLSNLRQVLSNPHANDGTGEWKLLSPLKYKSDLLQQTVVVYAGFTCDLASVPKIPGLYANFGNRYHRPAVVHDYLCRTKAVPRNIADKVFLEAMRAQNEEELGLLFGDEKADRAARLEGRAQAMYAAVVAYTLSGRWKDDYDA